MGAALGVATTFALSPELPPSLDPDPPAPASADPDADPDPDPEPALEVAPSPPLDSPPPDAPGFTDEYPSLYQPPPLNEIAAAVIVRSSLPPHCGQTVRSASENFWIFSIRRWHPVHSYS